MQTVPLRRLPSALVAACCVALLTASPSDAGIAQVERSWVCYEDGCDTGGYEAAAVRYTDTSGEMNTVTMSYPHSGYSDTVAIWDSTATVTAGPGCELMSRREAWCRRGVARWVEGYAALGALNDSATLRPGVDITLDGGDGSDVLTGNERWTTMYGGKHADVLSAGDGRDSLRGGDGDDLLDGGQGPDLLAGERGFDTATYASRAANQAVFVLLDNYPNDGGAADSVNYRGRDQDWSIERAIGGAGGDVFSGNAGANRFSGGPGDDIFSDSGAGDDLLIGGPGDDRFDGGAEGEGADTFEGGDGSDHLDYQLRDAPVAVRLDGVANDGADPDRDGTSTAIEEGDRDIAIERVTGSDAADRLTGNAAFNVLAGRDGGDRLDGGAGTDLLDGGAGIDMIDYSRRTGPVAVTLDGVRNDGADPDASGDSSTREEGDLDVSIEVTWGGGGPDILSALQPGLNIISGQGGADRLFARDGGSVADHVYCGSGTDSFQVDGVDRTYACETAVP